MILPILRAIKNIDFCLLQEVDQASKRSYDVDQVQEISQSLSEYGHTYAINYRSQFVPVPPLNPMGPVTSGQMILSKYHVDSAIRIGFDKHPAWPGRLFYMKRCFLVNYIPLTNGKTVVLINIHNSAFDSSGQFRKREMEQLGAFIQKAYQSGKYVIAGGDWNANPPGFDPTKIESGDSVFVDPFAEMMAHLPGWQGASDPRVPTNRHVDTPYKQGATPTTILDFFVASPNIDILKDETFPLGFICTDHQPAILSCCFDWAESCVILRFT